MAGEENKSGELVQNEEQTIDLAQFLPLGKKLIESHHEQMQEQTKLQHERLDFEREKLSAHKSAFSHKFWLLVGITVAILGISSGLIFYRGNVEAGMLMLSHVGAVVVGLIAGSGWERIQDR